MPMTEESEPTTANAEGAGRPETAGLATGAASELAQMTIFTTLGIPPELQKNAYQAVTRLTTSGVDWVASLIDNNRKERQAASEGRILLTKTASERIAARLEVSNDYIEAASEKFAERIVQGRKNVDAIAREAMDELRRIPAPEVASANPQRAALDEDWLNAFEAEAEQMTSEHARKLFGRILAGEINKPSTFSKKTLKLMSQLDNRAAAVFARAASIAITTQTDFDSRVVAMGNAGQNSLAAYGLSYSQLTLLQDYGLVAAELGGFCDHSSSVFRNGSGAPFRYGGASWVFVPTDDRELGEFRIEGVKLTATGTELLKVVDIVPNEAYTAALLKHFLDRGVSMNRVFWVDANSYRVELAPQHTQQ
jgi:hypothetical protein